MTFTFADAVWIFLFLVIAVWSYRQSLHVFGTWFSPLSSFVGIISLSVAAYHLRLLKMIDLSMETHAIILTAQASFALGVLLACESRSDLASIRKSIGDQVSSRRVLPQNLDHLDAFYLITALVATAGWMLAVAILVSRHGLASMLANIWVLQFEFQMQFIGYLNMVGILVLPTFVLKLAHRRIRRLDPLLLAGVILGLLLAGIKGYLVYSALTAMVVWAVVRPGQFRVAHLGGVLGVLLVFFIVYTQRVDVFVWDFYAGDGWFSNFKPLHRPYTYFVGAWPALQTVVDGTTVNPNPMGAATFQPVFKILGDGLGLIEPVPFGLPYAPIGTTLYNVYSFPGEIYWDWGWFGVPVFCGFWGWLGTVLFFRARRLAYWGHTLIYGILTYGLFLAGFVYPYRFNGVVMLLFVYFVGFVALRGGVMIERDARGR